MFEYACGVYLYVCLHCAYTDPPIARSMYEQSAGAMYEQSAGAMYGTNPAEDLYVTTSLPSSNWRQKS